MKGKIKQVPKNTPTLCHNSKTMLYTLARMGQPIVERILEMIKTSARPRT
jgi:hypothetical protein